MKYCVLLQQMFANFANIIRDQETKKLTDEEFSAIPKKKWTQAMKHTNHTYES